MPTRLIREGILTSDRVNSLSAKDEVFYRRLMSIVDDYGRYDARPAILRALLFPLQLDRIRESDIARGLAACEEAGLIRCYEVDGKTYLQLQKFDQQIRAKKSKWPNPLTDDNGCKQLHARAHLDESEYEDGCEGADESEGASELPKGGSVSVQKDFSSNSDSGSVPLARQKAQARWQVQVGPLIGRQDGATHPPGNKQHNSDMTCQRRIFDAVWPEEDDDEPPGYKRLMDLAKESATRKRPLAWLQTMLKKEKLL